MGHEVYCPLHFSCFDVRTGEALAPPAEQRAAIYAVKVADGKLLVSATPVDAIELSAPDAGEPGDGGELATAAPEDANERHDLAEEPEPSSGALVPCARPTATSAHARLIGAIEAQAWLESLAQAFASALRPVRESAVGGRLFDLLHGRVSGHALHPALSDLPIGLWIGALVLVVARVHDGAVILAVAGVVAGIATATTGVADWTVSDGRDRRLGLFHGITQTIALILVAGSVALSLADLDTGFIVALAMGTGLSAASAYLGGHLVLGRGVMVDRTAWTIGPRQWTRAIEFDRVPEGGGVAADLGSRQILVCRIDGVISAMENACTHAGGPLSMGPVTNGVIQCPWHGSCFRLRDGAVVKGPAQHPQPMLETRVNGPWVEVRGPRLGETNHPRSAIK